jgi:hypothetical protein
VNLSLHAVPKPGGILTRQRRFQAPTYVVAKRQESLELRGTGLAVSNVGFQPLPPAVMKLPIDVSAKARNDGGAFGSTEQEGFHWVFA